ncbi:siderophore esteras-like protein IroE-like protein [Aaosphaeria arxii CBS 175.79]|uniref:Siderophore esteras-like protein IroE-like protein n=1 Tax=Aaosphaeria arxii CBS 175.79 TaxID=1450172 RepID=A0A6A5XPB2_9PLEO|nr:siderophore esteras-like protein IroE-like protein [Aaosphaeria arxii CBS 175.79]KAF2014739.1 siderophore esteras-like protein IroE-like protein [Aaosphaeria arxii CBS 175.79]
MSAIGTWSFSPLITSFPSTVLPNVEFWKVTNGTWEYQVEIGYPLNWTSKAADSVVDTMYVLDGNALGLGATESFRRRRPVEFAQPDTIVVSIGYPETIADSPYSTHRSVDFQPPVCDTCTLPEVPGVQSGADNFIEFIDTVLRPWVQDTAFPNADFSRDALYGHSFGGLFVLYALIARPDLFDTFLSASPALFWNNDYILDNLGPLAASNGARDAQNDKPAFQISYGALEQFPVKRRTETTEAFEFRKSILEPMRMTTLTNQLYNSIKDSPALRDVELHEYPFSDHAAVGGAALSDGIDYFLDW